MLACEHMCVCGHTWWSESPDESCPKCNPIGGIGAIEKPPETIYLIPGEDIDGVMGYLWCDDPAPSNDHDPAEAVEYVRKERHVPTGRIVLRTNDHPSGRTYDTAEFFAYDQWWKTDVVCERDLMMVRRMADNCGLMFMDERRKV